MNSQRIQYWCSSNLNDMQANFFRTIWTSRLRLRVMRQRGLDLELHAICLVLSGHLGLPFVRDLNGLSLEYSQARGLLVRLGESDLFCSNSGGGT